MQSVLFSRAVSISAIARREEFYLEVKATVDYMIELRTDNHYYLVRFVELIELETGIR